MPCHYYIIDTGLTAPLGAIFKFIRSFILFLAVTDSELAGLCAGDLSKHWADLPAPRGDSGLFPASGSLQVAPGDEQPEEHVLSSCKLRQANKLVHII